MHVWSTLGSSNNRIGETIEISLCYSYIYREANRCADVMVSLACDMEADYMIYEEPPAPLLQLISFEVKISLPHAL